MKELEVKSMLADPNIPDSYKLGGRLDERFLAGVEYVEALIEEAPELWIARDRDDDRIYLYEDNPACDEECGMFYECDNDFIIELPKESFPEVTFENSPQKIKIIIK
jgi:hypothetical protein